MKLEADGGRDASTAVDLSDSDLDPERVAAAVRRGAFDGSVPGRVHAHLGCLARSPRIDRRSALAAVARSRGADAPQDGRIRSVSATLAGMDPAAVDLRGARARVAETGAERERLRERVAMLQGRVRALREGERDPGRAESALREAVRTLSEVETERAAAEQALAGERRRAREARDVRDRRLRLEDRLANLERDARTFLARSVRPDVKAALDAVPGTVPAESELAFGLAAARVAELRAPVVLACRAFPTAKRAACWLDAPVVRL